MAKKHYTPRPRGGGNKIAKAIIAIVVLLAIVVGSVFATGAIITGTGNPAKWGKPDHTDTPPITPPNTDEEHKHTYDRTQWAFNDTHHYHKATCEHFLITDVAEHTYANGVCSVCGYKYNGTKADMLITNGGENGVSLASAVIDKKDYIANGISTYADTAYTLTATVYDEQHTTNGMPQLVDATASFETPSSEWANGKNVSDYITLTRTADNAFNVVCRQEFGEPIIITVTAINSDKSATRRCDYVKRVTNVTVDAGINSGDTIEMPTTIPRNETTYGVGTLQGDVTFDQIVFLIERSFMNDLMETSYYKYFAKQCEVAGFELDLGWESVKQLNVRQESFQFEFNLVDILLTNMDVPTVTAISETVGLDYFKYAVIETASKAGFNGMRYQIYYTYTYAGIMYSKNSCISGPPSSFDTKVLGELPPVGSIEIDGNGNIIF